MRVRRLGLFGAGVVAAGLMLVAACGDHRTAPVGATTTMEGLVLAYADSMPIAGMRISVWESHEGMGPHMAGTELATAVTDHRGWYRLSFRASCAQGRRYEMRFSSSYQGRGMHPADACHRVCLDEHIHADHWVEPH